MPPNDINHEILSERRSDTPGHTAQALLWTMNNLLTWDAPHPKAGMHLLRSPETVRTVWASHGGAAGAEPALDPTREMIVGIFQDEGSYRRCPGIVSIRVENGRIHIGYRYAERPWKMKNPCSVVRVPLAQGEAVFSELIA